MKEYKSKKAFKETLNNMDAIEIYQELLRGKRIKRLPNGFWQRPEAEQNMIKVIKYMIEEILQWNEEDIKEKLSTKTFKDNGLRTLINIKSLYELINLVYPDKFKPWEFHLNNGYWNDENHIIEAVKFLIEDKLKWTDEDIKNNISVQTFSDYGFKSILNHKSIYEIINTTYPNRFKPWELKYISNGYWNDENHIMEAVKFLIEDKLKWNEEDIKENLSTRILRDNGFRSILNHKSLYEIINTTYPNRFKPWDLKQISNGYWNDENHIIEAVKWLIDDKLKWTDEDIKENLSTRILRDNGLGSLLNRKTIYELINLTYPNRFKINDFKYYKRFKGDE